MSDRTEREVEGREKVGGKKLGCCDWATRRESRENRKIIVLRMYRVLWTRRQGDNTETQPRKKWHTREAGRLKWAV